jgi:hypothetical protein
MVIDAATNEMRFFGDRGDGTVEELGSIGITQEGSDYWVAIFGTQNAGNSRGGVFGKSASSIGVYGASGSSFGLYATSAIGYGGFFRTTSGPAPLRLYPASSPSAPTHFANMGSLWVTSDGKMYINSDDAYVWALLLTSYQAGNIELYSNTREDYTSSASYVKVKEVIIGLPGTLRIDFQLKSSSPYAAYGRIYKNGVAVGTERTTTSSIYVNFSEDIGGWSAGDLCQIYIKHPVAATAYTKDLILKADKTFIPKETL